MFQRPAGNRDYRLTVRATEGVYKAVDGSRRFDTTAAGVVGEMIYASTSIDVGAGYERLSSNGPDADRWYVSSGVRTKTGVVSVSVEGHYGRIGGEDEVSAALGLQYDVARGLSLNLGLNRRERAGDARRHEPRRYQGDSNRAVAPLQLLTRLRPPPRESRATTGRDASPIRVRGHGREFVTQRGRAASPCTCSSSTAPARSETNRLVFTASLAAFVPRPRAHLTRYHGVFARTSNTATTSSPSVLIEPPANPRLWCRHRR